MLRVLQIYTFSVHLAFISSFSILLIKRRNYGLISRKYQIDLDKNCMRFLEANVCGQFIFSSLPVLSRSNHLWTIFIFTSSHALDRSDCLQTIFIFSSLHALARSDCLRITFISNSLHAL